MQTFEDLAGKRFGKLIAVERVRDQNNIPKWRCICDCGGESLVLATSLKSGNTKACLCGRHNKRTHGMSETRSYTRWAAMLSRCTNPKDPNYHHYGGRGIKICERWMKFENYLSDLGERPRGMSLERIDNDGPYSPENCRWATQAEQRRNARNTRWLTWNGVTKPLVDWAKELGMTVTLLDRRRRQGWSDEAILTTPPKTKYVSNKNY